MPRPISIMRLTWPILLALSGPASAQDDSPAPAPLTVERIYESGEFGAEGFGPARWLEDGGYTVLERDDDRQSMIARYDPETGERTVLVTAERLTPPGERNALPIADYQWSEDGRRLLIFTNTRRVWRQNTRGDFWVLDLDSGRLHRLGEDLERTRLQFAKFSPDGDSVAYVHRNDLHVERLDDGVRTPLTTDGSPTLINGTFDWVYEEEWSLRDGFRWSPDGRHIAFWQINDEGVQRFPLVDLVSDLYPEITWIAYPKAGTTNPGCRIGVVAVPKAGEAPPNEVQWIDLPGDERDDYVARLEWTPDGHLLIQRVNRRQDTVTVLDVDPEDWRPRVVFEDRDDAWVEVCDDVVWLDDAGRRFTWTSERGGWRQVWVVDRDGSPPVCITPRPEDVTSVLRIDPAGDRLWYLAAPDDPTRRSLFVQPLSGGEPRRVTPSDQPGWHDYQISDDGRYAIHRWSSNTTPPQVELVTLPDHEPVAHFPTVRNETLAAKIAALAPVERSFFEVELPDGTELDGWMMFPPDFDPDAGRWPLIMYVYGEPAATTVNDRWDGGNLWHRLLAEQGYVVASIDNRGTPAPKGRAWRKSVYGEVGVLASQDQADAVRALIDRHEWIDPDRVGSWGWSGGGSMTLNALFRHPDLYAAGIAVAFVADQRYYDTIYQERFMNTPQANPEGYHAGSPIHHAAGLEDPVLLIYGTGDDNCHYQNLEALVDELVRLGKPFDLLSYPNRSHGIHEGDGTTRHLRESMLRWWHRHLPAGPVASDRASRADAPSITPDTPPTAR